MNEKNRNVLMLVLIVGLVVLAGVQAFAIGNVVQEVKEGDYALDDTNTKVEKNEPNAGSPQMVGGC